MSNNELLLKYGRDVLESEYFSAAKHQVHHIWSTVASHSINTALVCIAIWRILKLCRIRLDLPILITAALAHDLGMVGRGQKYASNRESYRKHSEVSVKIMQMIRPRVDSHICEAISTHMYPVTSKKTASKEAWTLCIADKLTACTDWFFHTVL